MTDATLLSQITEAIRSVAKIPADLEIQPDSLLIEDLSVDSLDFVGIVLKIQDDFDVAIDEEDVPRLRSVADLAAYVSTHRGAAAA